MTGDYEQELIEWAHKYKAYERFASIQTASKPAWPHLFRNGNATAGYRNGRAWTCYAPGRSTASAHIASMTGNRFWLRIHKLGESPRPSVTIRRRGKATCRHHGPTETGQSNAWATTRRSKEQIGASKLKRAQLVLLQSASTHPPHQISTSQPTKRSAQANTPTASPERSTRPAGPPPAGTATTSSSHPRVMGVGCRWASPGGRSTKPSPR